MLLRVSWVFERNKLKFINSKETKPTEKYVRPMPPLVEPYLQENLVEMNGQKHHAFKFIDDSGYITNDSLLSFIDMPKKSVKVRVEKGKKGRMVDQKLVS